MPSALTAVIILNLGLVGLVFGANTISSESGLGLDTANVISLDSRLLFTVAYLTDLYIVLLFVQGLFIAKIIVNFFFYGWGNTNFSESPLGFTKLFSSLEPCECV